MNSFIVRPPAWFRNMLPGMLWRVNPSLSGQKTVYLTFDDGPHPEVTPRVLDKLAEHGAKATFFCIGRNVERYPGIFQMIPDHGHEVGNHTCSHLNGARSGVDEYCRDVELASRRIRSDLFRPPYGRIRMSQLKKLRENYRVVMWDVLSYDFSRKVTPEKCLKNVLDHVRPGSVIVFHDSPRAEKNMKYALERVLGELPARGYDFGVLQTEQQADSPVPVQNRT